jgi:uncharacterized protein (DUF305 family)
MKKILIITVAFFLGCNQQDKKQENHDHMEMNKSAKNPMTIAMDESMKKMHNSKQTGNPDFDFASMMIPAP